MSDLVMRLETAAAKCDQRVKDALPQTYDQLASDWRDLFQEAARRIKKLEHDAHQLDSAALGRL
jgi:hypothetical protein